MLYILYGPSPRGPATGLRGCLQSIHQRGRITEPRVGLLVIYRPAQSEPRDVRSTVHPLSIVPKHAALPVARMEWRGSYVALSAPGPHSSLCPRSAKPTSSVRQPFSSSATLNPSNRSRIHVCDSARASRNAGAPGPERRCLSREACRTERSVSSEEASGW